MMGVRSQVIIFQVLFFGRFFFDFIGYNVELINVMLLGQYFNIKINIEAYFFM